MTTRRTVLKSASSLLLAPGMPAFAVGADWDAATPESQGMPSVDIDGVLAKGADIGGLRGVAVVRHGKMLAERYYDGVGESVLRPVNSVTKSVASLLVGQAIAQGKIKNVEQTVASLLPGNMQHANAPVLAVTLRQILTGTAGLAYDFRTQFRDLATAADPVGFVMGLAKNSQPAGVWSYNDAAISLLTPILEHAHGMALTDIAKRDLFDPLGIRQFSGQTDKAGRVTAYAGLQLRTRDLAKIAWVMTNGGQWQGRGIVSPDWVTQSTQTYSSPDWRVSPMTSIGYGYLWFTGRLGKHQAVWAWGYGAQFALFVPSLNLVVATSATSPRPTEVITQNNAVMGLVNQVVALAA